MSVPIDKNMMLATPLDMEKSSDGSNLLIQRLEATIPGYWTVEELARELQVTRRKVLYDITGNAKLGVKQKLNAYQLGQYYLVPDENAITYITLQREKNRK